jgi:hypothetical protein
MTDINRRHFLQMGGTASTASLGAGISKALAIPAYNRTGTIKDR